MTELMKMGDFAPHLNTKFVMHLGESETRELELTDARQITLTDEQDEFALLFLGPDDSPPAQGIYKLSHEAMGSLEIFLVPIRKDQNGVTYEAVFNLLPKEFQS
ncbi:MAG TPA: hypothetical protein VE262_04390 [Blastocatellia bacterium]|nr:hypothetical protein [Blastocatellia bacterium]